MAQTETPAPEIEIESGTYEILRNRLAGHGKELRRRLDQLNEARKEVFGSIDTALVATERITTAHNCVPRDMVAVGQRLLFGYNVHFGLKTERHLEDVFAVYEFRERTFHEQPLDLIREERFEKNFQDVYRYYKDATFAKFFLSGPYVYMKFHVGKTVDDFKSFKWARQGDALQYVDNRSDHEVRNPPQHEFEWVRTHRDLHRSGMHPHISIDDRVFVETVGGDLTIKIENNTDSGEGIYSEPVDNKDQTLDDAEIYYAIVGNLILLKVRPYQEPKFRYIVYNEKTQQARRLDAIEHACVLLPDDHGLIFSSGYYLQNGDLKTFDQGLTGMLFERRIPSPNGEDYLYVFYNRQQGIYVLLQYNVIRQQVETPIVCNGFTLFEAGELVCFKCHEQPQKHHAIQIWQTPFTSENYVPPVNNDSYLFKVGNRDLVRAMAECHEMLTLIDKEDSYAGLYVDLEKLAQDVIDSYFWIDNEAAFRLKEPLAEIKAAAAAAVSEYEKVVRLRQNTAEQTQRVRKQTSDLLREISHGRFEQINDFVQSLGRLRSLRGEIISLRDLRYVDNELVDSLEREVAEESDRLARRCVEFLLRPDALEPYAKKVADEQAKIDGLEKVSDAKQLEEQVAASASELEMLIEIVSNLKIDDATQRTTIIDNISAIFATINQARAALKRKTKELLSVEGRAEFASQMKLLNQAVVNYLDVCDTPARCDEFLTKLMIQVEELEGRFAEFDEFVVQLTEQRQEIYNAFESRKLALVEARNKRANSLAAAADRILKGIKTRVESFESVEEINGYFASDLMIDKVRDIVRQLGELDDSVKVDEIQSRLKTVREDAVRQLKDRQELFVGGQDVIRLGSHQFNVNTQPLDLTTVLREGEQTLHLTGTNFFEPIEDERLRAARDLWDQELVSENRDVYRAEYLAYLIHESASQREPRSNGQAGGLSFRLDDLRTRSETELRELVQKFMAPRYSEGYVKGVHDHDAARILDALAEMSGTIGLLRFSPSARALGSLYWGYFGHKKPKAHLAAQLQGVGTISRLFPDSAAQASYAAELRGLLDEFLKDTSLFDKGLIHEAADYLFAELTTGGRFVISRRAANLYEAFQTHLQQHRFDQQFAESIKAVQSDTADCFQLARNWLSGYLAARENSDDAEYLDETALLLLDGKVDASRVVDADIVRELEGLSGSHPRTEGGRYRLHYHEFTHRVGRFAREVVPRYEEYVALKKQTAEQAREEMKLEEFRPRVLTSFVRNRLLDTVYLPLIGDNLAKQIGVAGEAKRTDRSGLLLLISPPGYGKTTLMEYVANRLGVIFMKINGPALGHRVTSLDPGDAPNAAAREELHKLAIAFEMGDNVMIYVDDIQHCHSEFLQKFISLCDAQRKVEGVYKGKTRTYDFRGRKVAVVMAGNPYTESGEKFQIPDMLANRADIYNLGDIIGDSREAFELSYLEIAAGVNPALHPLTTRSPKDIYAIVRMAEQHGQRDGIELQGNYSLEELNEMVAVMQKLIRVRDVVLTVNLEYIRSAGQSDDYRTEPPFKLQGSYRNMNRIAERVVPVMNDRELETLIMSSYEQDAQTLTTGAEANLLKLRELIGKLTPQEAERWASIKQTFQRNVKLRGIDTGDKLGQAIAQLTTLADGLDSIRNALTGGLTQLIQNGNGRSDLTPQVSEMLEQFRGVRGGLEQIGAALSGGLANLSELPTRLTPPPAPDSTPALRELSDSFRTLADELQSLVEAAFRPSGPRVSVVDSGNGPHEGGDSQASVPATITVVNKLPRTVMSVLEQQFELMQTWLKPLLSTATAQSAEIQELRRQIEICLRDYERLVGRLEKARDRTGE